MSITSKLAYLEGTKDYIRQCIQQKGVSVPASTTFREYGDKILLIETGSTEPPDVPTPELNLQEKTANPTGTQFDVTPDSDYNGLSKVIVTGEVNLKPENIAYGVTIYGVTGTMVPPANMTTVPDAYKQLFEQARQLYTGDYKNLMILESDQAVAFGFMLDGFKVMSYDDSNSEFTAQKWVYVAYNKGTGQWKVEDWSNSTSNGNSYIKNIRYSDAYIYYGTRLLYPFIVNEDDPVIGVPNDVFKIVVQPLRNTIEYRVEIAGLFSVDWGDGSDSEEYSTTDYTSYMLLSHKFPAANEYTVTFIGYMRAFRRTSSSSLSERITALATPLPQGCEILTGQSGAGVGFFYNNGFITSIPNDFFSKSKIYNMSKMFGEMTALTSIPPDLLINTPITSAEEMFSGCKLLTSIPASLFANGVSLQTVKNCFNGCSKIMAIPSHLFDNCPNLTNVSGCFYGMTMVSGVPEGLFKNHYSSLDMSFLFGGCTGLTSFGSDLFENIDSMDLSHVFYNTRITTLPNLDGKTITSLESAFYNTKITSIPEDYLDEVEGLTTIKEMFLSCKSLAHIPEWWNNPTLSSITHTSCFNQCTNADNYSERPSGW